MSEQKLLAICPNNNLVRADVLGVGVHAIDMGQAVAVIDDAVSRRRKGYVCVTDVHAIMQAQSDINFKNILNHSLLTTPDGMPTVWIGRSQGFGGMDRVYGPDLMLEVCRLSEQRGYTHYLYGGNEGVAEKLASCLLIKFPKLKIVGTYTPPFRPLNSSEESDLHERLALIRPDIIWVGMSTPKQERFMAGHIESLDCTLMVGVGAAFDFHTGRTKDAPRWIKRAGLQWLHRLCQEPRRLWKRYFTNIPKFMFSIAVQLVRQRPL